MSQWLLLRPADQGISLEMLWLQIVHFLAWLVDCMSEAYGWAPGEIWIDIIQLVIRVLVEAPECHFLLRKFHVGVRSLHHSVRNVGIAYKLLIIAWLLFDRSHSHNRWALLLIGKLIRINVRDIMVEIRDLTWVERWACHSINFEWLPKIFFKGVHCWRCPELWSPDINMLRYFSINRYSVIIIRELIIVPELTYLLFFYILSRTIRHVVSGF